MKTQCGAVLVIGLITLLIMTLLSVAAMQVTSLEEKMAGNLRNRNLAFQAAESALLAGEDFLTDNNLPIFANSNGLYQPTVTGDQRWETVDWNDVNQVIAYQNGLYDVATPPRYIIEELPTVLSEGSLEAATPAVAELYRITARAVGADPNAIVMLQSTYRR